MAWHVIVMYDSVVLEVDPSVVMATRTASSNSLLILSDISAWLRSILDVPFYARAQSRLFWLNKLHQFTETLSLDKVKWQHVACYHICDKLGDRIDLGHIVGGEWHN